MKCKDCGHDWNYHYRDPDKQNVMLCDGVSEPCDCIQVCYISNEE